MNVLVCSMAAGRPEFRARRSGFIDRGVKCFLGPVAGHRRRIGEGMPPQFGRRNMLGRVGCAERGRPGSPAARDRDGQIAVLPPTDWAAWLYLTKPEVELPRPLPAGMLNIETEMRQPDLKCSS